MNAAQLSAIAFHVPELQLGNVELAAIFSGWTPEKITLKLGIENRPIAAGDETAVDLAVAAGNRLFDSGVCCREEIDFVVLCTQSPDYFLPTSACLVQNRLGIPTRCGAFDINLGCSGFVYSLGVCKGLVESGMAKKVLLLTSETYSKYINKLDRTSRPLFGDGATASLITLDENATTRDWWIGPFEFGTDGAGANMLMVPAGAQRMPATEETAKVLADGFGSFRSKNDLFMNGRGIFTFSIDTIPPLVDRFREIAEKNGWTIDSFIFHQANRYMLNRLQGLCRIDDSQYYNNMLQRGNTVSSSIPIAMVDAFEENFLKRGDLTLLVGFGVGLSWGASFVRLPEHFVSVPQK
ncbi:MAG: ketoacyl-ACP synthase III [Thermoguttaceae bacterium]|nr:ketoacyl-ACP synthase III [Thermoguttaceae bacterium]